MNNLNLDSRLLIFKTKIDGAVSLVPDMTAEEKLRAVQFWNVISEKLQEIVNNSAADINALAAQFEEEKMTSKAAELSDRAIDSKSFENFDLNRPNGTNLTSQPEDESLDFPDIPSSNLTDSILDSNTIVNGQPSTMSLPISGINPQRQAANLSESIESTPPSSQNFHAADHHEALTMDENHNGSNECGLAHQLQSIDNVPLHCTSNRVNDSISNLTNINSGNNVYAMETATRTNVIQSAPKLYPSQALELSFQGNNSSLSDNLGVESENSFISENGESNLHIDRFGAEMVGHINIPMDLEDDDNELEIETLMASHHNVNPSMSKSSIDNLNETSMISSQEDVLQNSDGKSYTCDICGKVSASHSSYTSHKWVHTKPYGCSECGAKFSTKGNLLVHQRRHTGEKPFACDKCTAIFSTKGNLRRHIKAHSGERSWKCEICDSKFTEKKSLKVHMRRHTGERPYKCKVCNKAFSQTGVLQTHMALHLDERKYLCEMCGKAFRQRSQLRLHVLRHEGVKKWDCTNCSAKFLTKGDLERHFRVHTGERPFVCPLCGKTFTRQQSLNEHSNRHYGLKPYSCDICNKKFAEMSACYKHIKIHKKQKQKNEPTDEPLVNQAQQHFATIPSSNDDYVPFQPIIT